jgi:hypothetical protein
VPHALICSLDEPLSDLMCLALERRGWEVRQTRWAACCGDPAEGPATGPDAVEVVIADLDCPGPACWRAVPVLRGLFNARPLGLLAHDWPSFRQRQAWGLCGYIRKPIALTELLRVVAELAPAG